MPHDRRTPVPTVTALGTPIDVTSQAVMVEHFFPANEKSEAFFQD